MNITYNFLDKVALTFATEERIFPAYSTSRNSADPQQMIKASCTNNAMTASCVGITL